MIWGRQLSVDGTSRVTGDGQAEGTASLTVSRPTPSGGNHAGRLFDAPQRPVQSPQPYYSLFLVVAQDVAHPQRLTGSPAVGW